ncbi:hypothetical protein CSV80_14535 [Sporosarcina sp. P12(2017)]|uniref:hypothetical protein n=1 Tax=unclassified Sporosarcina TaxID=2647733 RepID=UPI000C172347|nr:MULTISPECIES: hypothetical protein [unclassified Sporosarcina]PIC56462.1 hypothetical protein CSV81_14400 [Sporosarcina sp. P10]PIC59759.1 hypothetical protein CSV80_14535 [Sporosarcina sp. P12(2017)]
MKNGLEAVLEMFRIAIILLLIGSLMGGLVKLIYSAFGINVDDTHGAWLVGGSILIILFVLYRNKLQFSGFYKGDGKVKLPKRISTILISSSILMLIIAPVFR